HHINASVPEYAVDCDCRKPKPGMIFTACRELGIDAAQSFMVGDKPRDVECGEAAGAKGVLYEGGSLLACVKRAVEQR
ncbi:MAG: HAD-IIIA family hydrolase, partial [Selenomonadaceae bacterium]|nr:HAD-IIIA family hydrolase [Selenomonadaceae bacterium]